MVGRRVVLLLVGWWVGGRSVVVVVVVVDVEGVVVVVRVADGGEWVGRRVDMLLMRCDTRGLGWDA